MGWYIDEKNDKFRIFSNNSETFLTDFISRNEILKQIFWKKFDQLIDEMLKDIFCFPAGFKNYETEKIYHYENEQLEKYFNLLKDNSLRLNTFINELHKLGISIDVSDF